MAVTFDKTANSGSAPWGGTTKDYVLKRTIDLNAITGIVSTDIVQALNISAGTLVRKVIVKVLRAAAGTSGSATVGDGAGATGWDTSIDLKGAAGTFYTNGLVLAEAQPNTIVDAYTAGKIYSAADTIDLVVTLHADLTDKGSVEVIALCTDLN